MRRFGTVLSLLLAVSAGPLVVPQSAHAAITHNRLASNRLASNRLASNRLASNRLASNRLSANGLSADMDSAGEMLATADGREVYAYMMSCALPAGLSIEATIAGAPESSPTDAPPYDTIYTCRSEHCVFEGGMGLAPKWIDHKLNKKGQRWISACLFARVNASATTEAISLRGDHDALAVSEEEVGTFALEEGAFYGQFFTEADEPVEWYACLGRDQEDGAESGGLYLRECAEPDPDDPTHTICGFTYTGECQDFSPVTPTPYACQSFDDSYYSKCHDFAATGKWSHSRKQKQVITVFVATI